MSEGQGGGPEFGPEMEWIAPKEEKLTSEEVENALGPENLNSSTGLLNEFLEAELTYEKPEFDLQTFVDAADAEIEQIDKESLIMPNLPLTEMETAEAILRLGETPDKIIERLKTEPTAATFSSLRKILTVKEGEISDLIEDDVNPRLREGLEQRKRHTQYEIAAVKKHLGIENIEDLDEETCEMYLDRFLRGEVGRYSRLKEGVDDAEQEKFADATIEYFRALHGQTFDDESEDY